MLYQLYQARQDLLAPLRITADLAGALLQEPHVGPCGNFLVRSLAAGAEMVCRTRLTHERPAFGIDEIVVNHRPVAVTELPSLVTPFGTLLHFKKNIDAVQPRVLLVAPMAGHFSTLLRDTVATLLPDHDVYITDWHNARDISRDAGRFGLDEFVDHIIRFLDHIGPGAHVVGVCQPCNALVATVALMSETGHAALPRSMTLMAGPVDTRINPTKVNELATSNSIDWFACNLITAVPGRYRGAYRRVYPGFMQLSAFMSMNLVRHIRAHLDLFEHLARGEDEKAAQTRKFYDEYFAVLDLPAEFYLETVQRVFQEHRLARGLFEWRGRRLDARAIADTALLTVEGEKDDICAPGQTMAAHDLCTSIKPHRKQHHLQPGVGHYGVFSGARWRREIYPAVQSHIAVHN
ncbi:MAG TPA: polyhydroxyalkanoate depolymerase [Rhizomicrobium sp.]|nr:polyhydroxyalkanoate depolymerase [Rhizomicrobium sp.]